MPYTPFDRHASEEVVDSSSDLSARRPHRPSSLEVSIHALLVQSAVPSSNKRSFPLNASSTTRPSQSHSPFWLGTRSYAKQLLRPRWTSNKSWALAKKEA